MDTHLRTVGETHAKMKEKPRGWVGAHRGGQSSLRSDEGFLRNQCLGVSQMKGQRITKGRTAFAELSGMKQCRLYLLIVCIY